MEYINVREKSAITTPSLLLKTKYWQITVVFGKRKNNVQEFNFRKTHRVTWGWPGDTPQRLQNMGKTFICQMTHLSHSPVKWVISYRKELTEWQKPSLASLFYSHVYIIPTCSEKSIKNNDRATLMKGLTSWRGRSKSCIYSTWLDWFTNVHM